jgi:hypothetical protein
MTRIDVHIDVVSVSCDGVSEARAYAAALAVAMRRLLAAPETAAALRGVARAIDRVALPAAPAHASDVAALGARTAAAIMEALRR